MAVKYDFSDVKGWFDDEEKRMIISMEQIGRDAVDYAKMHGSYKNHTFRLRKGNRYHVDKSFNLNLHNIMFYAPYVEARHYDVLGNAALYARSRLRKEFE